MLYEINNPWVLKTKKTKWRYLKYVYAYAFFVFLVVVYGIFMEINWRQQWNKQEQNNSQTNNVQMRANKSWWPTGNMNLDDDLKSNDGLWSILN